MSNIILTTESTVDLLPEIIERYQIETIPMPVLLEDKTYFDGVDLVPDDIYRIYKEKKGLPKTSAITPDVYRRFFSSFTEEGNTVIHVALSSGISSTCQNAMIAASEMENVYVIDSQNLSTGIALPIIKAAEMRDGGIPAKDIIAKLPDLCALVETSFVIDNLEFLAKGGRCSSLTALGANLLNLKPSIEMAEGKLSTGKKYRGKLERVYVQYAIDRLASRDDIDESRVFVTHSGIPQSQIDVLVREIKKNFNFDEILVSRAGCTISAHCGPNTMGVLFMRKG